MHAKCVSSWSSSLSRSYCVLIQDTPVGLDIHRALPFTCINRKRDREILFVTSFGYIRAYSSALQNLFISSSSATTRTSTSFLCQIQTDTIIRGRLIVTGMSPIYPPAFGLKFALGLTRYKTRQKMGPNGRCFGLDMNRFVRASIPQNYSPSDKPRQP